MNQPLQLERLVTTLGRLAQRDGQLRLQIVAGLDLRTAPPAESAAAAEEIGELREDILDAREALEARRRAAAMTIAIVGRALVRVREDLIGLGQLLEALLGLLIAGIAVGMVLHRQPPVRLLHLGHLASRAA